MVTIWLTFVAENSLLVPIIGTMMNPTWRLSEYTPDNLGLAFTDEGLLLGRTPLIERRGGRFVVREASDIARLVKYSFPGGVAVDRLMPGLARIASALNANDRRQRASPPCICTFRTCQVRPRATQWSPRTR